MRNFSIKLAVVLITTVWTTGAAVGQYTLHNKPRQPLGNNPNPVIWGGQSAKPAPRPPAKKIDRHVHHDRSHHGYHRSHYGFHAYSPHLHGSYRCVPNYFYYYRYPHSYIYTPVYNYAYADNFFGPRVAQRFLGMGNQVQPAVVAPDAEAPAPAPRKVPQRATNAQANALAWRFIGFGDAQFAQQNYIEANNRYRKASRSAPQVADAWFRQAFALSAMGRSEQAVAVVQRGLRIDPDWPRSDFNLEELFGADEGAKNVYLDTLTEAVENNPHDADPLFMRGVFLHLDGQTDQAEKCFKRSLRLAGGDVEHIRAFLAK